MFLGCLGGECHVGAVLQHRRLRCGGLGGEMDRIAAYLSEHSYKRGSAKIYLNRLSRFSSHVARTARAKPIDQAMIDRFVEGFPTESPSISARTAIELARGPTPDQRKYRRNARTCDVVEARVESLTASVRRCSTKDRTSLPVIVASDCPGEIGVMPDENPAGDQE